MYLAKVVLILWVTIFAAFYGLTALVNPASPAMVLVIALIVFNSFACLWNIRFCWVVAIVGGICLAGLCTWEVYAILWGNRLRRQTESDIAYFLILTGILPPVSILVSVAFDWRRFIAMLRKRPLPPITMADSAEVLTEVSPPSSNPYEPPRQ